jgi:CRISPR-associated protein Cas1
MKPLPTTDAIIAIAGEKTFLRGQDYARLKRVNNLAGKNGRITATVSGGKDYHVEVYVTKEDKLQYICDCPVGIRKWLCKHVVAAVLAWNKSETENATEDISQIQEKLPQASLPDAHVPESVMQSVEEKTFSHKPVELKPNTPPLAWIPARMLNAFVFCPRLFYYEFVEGIFLHNAETLEGKRQHKRVDKPGKGLPKAKKDAGDTAEQSADIDPDEEAPPPFQTRSVELGSDRLAINAKLDLIEGIHLPDGRIAVSPVEYKRGAPAREDDLTVLWDADKMQLGAQILILRDNGYVCNSGTVFYRTTRQRVEWIPDAADIAWIEQKVTEARRTAQHAYLPPPLVDSPKCPGCSLAPVCLPDESLLLAKSAEEEVDDASADPIFVQLELDLPIEFLPDDDELADSEKSFPDVTLPSLKPSVAIRRLVAPNPETRPLYLNTPGAFVRLRGETVIAECKGSKLGEWRLIDLHHIALMGPIQISTALVQACCEREIPIVYTSMGGYFYGITRGHGLVNVTSRVKQFAAAADTGLALHIARLFVHGKIRNQRVLLMRNHVQCPPEASRALKWFAALSLKATSTEQLFGIEGNAAAIYFANFAGMLRGEDGESGRFSFNFNGRNRRPPRDPVNAVLSLCYALLVKECTLACSICGLDPYVGFLHKIRHGKPSLALDLMEEFRPLIADSATLTLFNNRMLSRDDFITAGDAVSLTPTARRSVYQVYERRLSDVITHPVFGYKVSYRRAIELQARLLAKVVSDEIESYIPFLTR